MSLNIRCLNTVRGGLGTLLTIMKNTALRLRHQTRYGQLEDGLV